MTPNQWLFFYTDGFKGKRTVERLTPPLIIALRETITVKCEPSYLSSMQTYSQMIVVPKNTKDKGSQIVGSLVVSKALAKSKKLKVLNLNC